MDAFRHGELPRETVHVCLDMQRLFARGGPWAAPWFERVLPRVRALAWARPESTVFTRFIPPQRAEDAPGAWAAVYRRWPQVTREQLDPALLELTEELAGLVPPATVLDKSVYSAFHGTHLAERLARRGVRVVVFSGAETDLCVLASVLDAVDLGYRAIVARDAICSSNDASHDAALRVYRERFSQQVEVATVGEILRQWRR